MTATKTRPRRKATKKKRVKKDPWREILTCLPGYDPYRDAKGYYFDERAAENACDFFPLFLTHVRGFDGPIELEPWQKAIVANLMGWKSEATGLRRFREMLMYVPRGNAKTTIAAGFPILIVLTDQEPGAECYVAAADGDQASILFDIAKEMVESERWLDERLRVYGGAGAQNQKKSIILRSDPASFFRPIASGTAKVRKAKHGYNSHLVIIDELHAQDSDELFHFLDTSMGKRKQPLFLQLTTADHHRESICNSQLKYAKEVRDGIIRDPTFLPVIYEASAEDDWTDERVWKRANPNYGVSVNPEHLRRKCEKAKVIPRFENEFKRLHLNIQTEQAFRAIQMKHWDACAGGTKKGQWKKFLEEFEGETCYAGLDLSERTDLSAFLLYFPHNHGVIPYFWIPAEKAVERERSDRVPYRAWESLGAIDLIKGSRIDRRNIRAAINEAGERFSIREIGYDPAWAGQIVTELDEDGFDLVKFKQTFPNMNPAWVELENLIHTRKLRHGGHPVLRQNALGVALDTHRASGMVRPSKGESFARIDGIVALTIAVGIAAGHREDEDDYEEMYPDDERPEDFEDEEAEDDEGDEDSPDE